MRKKGAPDVLVRSMVSLYEGAKTSVRVDYELSEEFEVNVGMHQRSLLSSLLFTFVVVVSSPHQSPRCGVRRVVTTLY